MPGALPSWAINSAYLVASILFIMGLKGLTHPRTAVRGNLYGALGMLLAIVVTLYVKEVVDPLFIWVGLAVGTAIGAFLAIKIEMTAMPQLVGLFNGFGGIASVLVAGAWLKGQTDVPEVQATVAAAASGLIGGVTFLGSLVAFGKLQGIKWVPSGNFLPAQKLINAGLFILAILLSVYMVRSGDLGNVSWLYLLLAIVAFALGVTLVTPIGGADMPVVIALLNSYSGLAASATGFVIGNNVLIIAGALVGASGVVLTMIMCKAMNRSLFNVIFGVMGPTSETPDADSVYEGKIKQTSADEVAMLLETARRVVIVPGYGMAVSQAQHAVRDLANLLESKHGTKVEFGIHPVAGRMPGHMNVLLAEANIPYDQLKEMDAINPEMDQVDMAIVIGANDVVNPVARTDPSSPIAGMPIIDVDKARTVVVIKRSLSPGYAGIPNPLFAEDNVLMFFSDGKKAFQELVEAVKES
ncbi:MAG: NAD(P)(+) transhydrogenase (Re/Si-specific) subunit beta [Planctomycetota bacterium]|nr:NAD(P)(+) transhydrogenase (Re/Si-specific) subunit beta [Planctomycetota bacterium]